jgi:2-phosphosulfolactate phosphatase
MSSNLNNNHTTKPTVEVCLTPALFEHYDYKNSIVVVIDVLRATSSICVAFQFGANSLVPVSTVEESLAYKAKGFLIGAERHGLMMEGFDFGNSPFSYMDEKIKGSNIALTTTNGTKAMNIAKNSYKVVAGSFLNLDALAKWLIQQNKNVVCLCSGWKDTFNLEDTLFAGALSSQLLHEHFEMSINRDSTMAAMHLYELAKGDLFEFLTNSSHRIRLTELQIEDDIIYCLTPNQTSVIPVLKNGVLYDERKVKELA